MQVRTTLAWRTTLLVLLMAMLVAPKGVQAQDAAAAASLSCRRQCATQVSPQPQNQRAAQVCLLRCAAGERHMRQQHRPGTPEATGRGTVPGGTAIGAAPGGRSLVAYAGTLPQLGLAISLPAERAMAHRAAEQECFRGNGNRPCRLLFETQERCVVVARAVRAVGLVVTRDPATYTVLHYGVGSGATPAAARDAAVRDCTARIAPGLQCRIAASRCG